MNNFNRERLRAYIQETLPEAEMATIEKSVRDSVKLQALLHDVQLELERAEHSVGAIWQRERITCPNREQLGGYLLDALDPGYTEYVKFHLETIACSYCLANLDDLRHINAEPAEPRSRRQRKIIDSSAGILQSIPGRKGSS